MKKCIYCGRDKPLVDFSDEHIWPDALGGDFLEPFWRTEDVCGRCNNLSGVFVDGAFIKSVFGGGNKRVERGSILTLPNRTLCTFHWRRASAVRSALLG